MILAVDSKLTWYVARSAGLVGWATVTASLVLGLAVSTRMVRRKGPPGPLFDLHKFLGALAVVFVTIHLVALWADSYVYFGPRELFVPLASTYRPLACAWGIVAAYLLVAIEATSWVMRHLSRRLWHVVHLTSFLLFGCATVHGFTAGADKGNVFVQWIALTAGLLVVVLGVFRFAPHRGRSAHPRVARAGDDLPSFLGRLP